MTPLQHHSNQETSAPAPATATATASDPINTSTASPPSSPGAPGSRSSSNPGMGKRRLSLFSFGLGSSSSPSSGSSKNKALPAISTSPSSHNNSALHNNNQSPSLAHKPQLVKSPSSSLVQKRNQSISPIMSPVSGTDSLSENPGSHIFERSVQDGSVKHEDYIPPALDATASILSDSTTDLDNVDMVYSSRRNSSVIGLNMALGRPYTPSRKNSVYSVSHLNSGNPNANSPVQLTSSSSFNYSQPSAYGGHPNSQPSSSQNQQNPNSQTQSPVSPPKLMSSRSSVSFYSYADMISNDEFSRRPSLMHAYSHGFVPTVSRKMSVASNQSGASNGNGPNCGGPNCSGTRGGNEVNKFPRKNPQPAMSPSDSQSQLSKQFKDRTKPVSSKGGEKLVDDGSSKKFLISPESSDSEDQEIYHPASAFTKPPSRRKSVVSNASCAHSGLDNDSFVSSSVGDCIRQCTTEIENN